MKNVVLGLILLSGLISRAGCGGPSLYTSLKIKYTTIIPAYNNDQRDTVIGIHPFEVKILPNGHCQDFEDLQVFRDDSLLLSVVAWNGPKSFSLNSFPGHYKIKCCWKYSACMGYSWEFDLVCLTLQTDSSTITTGLITPKKINPEFLFYPNPVSDVLYLKNESSAIQQIQIYNSKGELFLDENPNSSHFTIPLGSWPKGIYYLQVLILPEKTILKKILVE